MALLREFVGFIADMIFEIVFAAAFAAYYGVALLFMEIVGWWWT